MPDISQDFFPRYDPARRPSKVGHSREPHPESLFSRKPEAPNVKVHVKRRRLATFPPGGQPEARDNPLPSAISGTEEGRGARTFHVRHTPLPTIEMRSHTADISDTPPAVSESSERFESAEYLDDDRTAPPRFRRRRDPAHRPSPVKLTVFPVSARAADRDQDDERDESEGSAPYLEVTAAMARLERTLASIRAASEFSLP